LNIYGADQSKTLSKSSVFTLMEICSKQDGVMYVSFTFLNFTRPAVCLHTETGEQKILTKETAEKLLKEVEDDSN